MTNPSLPHAAAAPPPPPAGARRAVFMVQAAGASFGLPVDSVQTIFRLQSITPVPLGPPVIAGLVNLRGKIVVAVSLERRLDLQASEAAGSALAVAVERRGETFALLVDSVGDAIECEEHDRIAAPRHVSDERAQLTQAYYRTDGGILPVLDVDALFEIRASRPAARPQPTQTASAPIGAHS